MSHTDKGGLRHCFLRLFVCFFVFFLEGFQDPFMRTRSTCQVAPKNCLATDYFFIIKSSGIPESHFTGLGGLHKGIMEIFNTFEQEIIALKIQLLNQEIIYPMLHANLMRRYI